MKELAPDYITKIEGHGTLNINFAKETARLEIKEGERLFEGLLLGHDFNDGPFITSRICGICPTAHHIASIKAIEASLDIEPAPAVILLRKIMLAAQIIQSHNLHLFFLALPDYLRIADGIKLARKHPNEFAIVLRIKKLADKILTSIGGRAIHPIRPVIGGFTKSPTLGELADLRLETENTLDEAEYLIKLFAGLDYPDLSRKTEYLALSSLGELESAYPIYEGKIISNQGQWFSPQDYKKEIKEKIKPYSTAKFGLRSGKGFMVGALARLNLNTGQLNIRAKRALVESKINPAEGNPFYNNFAQSVEILHFLEEIVNLIDQLTAMPLNARPPLIEKKAGFGVGVIEAPRGTLYHTYKINKKGKITYLDIVTPTVQNLTNLEEDARQLLDQTKNLSQKERERLVEMLIRAYDPCITCSVH